MSEQGLFKKFPGYKNNLTVIKKAAKHKDLGLVECQDKKTGETVAVLCAFQTDGNGEVEFVPLARMFSGNPYEELNPPNPEGGYYSD